MFELAELVQLAQAVFGLRHRDLLQRRELGHVCLAVLVELGLHRVERRAVRQQRGNRGVRLLDRRRAQDTPAHKLAALARQEPLQARLTRFLGLRRTKAEKRLELRVVQRIVFEHCVRKGQHPLADGVEREGGQLEGNR